MGSWWNIPHSSCQLSLVHPWLAFGLASRETPLEDSHPHLVLMIDTYNVQQLQTRIAEMERRHEEELRKVKADHDQLKTRVECFLGDEHSAHTLLECTQGESHPRRTVNTADDLSLSHMHRPTGQTTCWHLFFDHIMEINIPLWWKSLNLKWYDGTIDPDEHLDAFLTQVNVYTNINTICVVSFQRPSWGRHWPGMVDFHLGP